MLERQQAMREVIRAFQDAKTPETLDAAMRKWDKFEVDYFDPDRLTLMTKSLDANHQVLLISEFLKKNESVINYQLDGKTLIDVITEKLQAVTTERQTKFAKKNEINKEEDVFHQSSGDLRSTLAEKKANLKAQLEIFQKPLSDISALKDELNFLEEDWTNLPEKERTQQMKEFAARRTELNNEIQKKEQAFVDKFRITPAEKDEAITKLRAEINIIEDTFAKKTVEYADRHAAADNSLVELTKQQDGLKVMVGTLMGAYQPRISPPSKPEDEQLNVLAPKEWESAKKAFEEAVVREATIRKTIEQQGVKGGVELPEGVTAKPGHYDVVISGAGPVGLACAYEALKKGKKVAIINNRAMTTFSRVQRIFLDENSRYYLFNMFPKVDPLTGEDERFYKELTKSTTIEVRDIESFLYRRIQELQKPEGSYLELPQSAITSINMKEGELKVGNPQQKDSLTGIYSFTNLIGADGAGHPSANILNNSLQDSNKINYSDVPGPKHPYHASIQLIIKDKNGVPVKLPDSQFIEVATKDPNDPTIKYLSGISLNKSNKKNNNSVKCTFGGEVPEAVYNKVKEGNTPGAAKAVKEAGREAARNHLETVMKEHLRKQNINTDNLVFELKVSNKQNAKKDLLKVQSFQTSLTRANKAAHEENNHRYILTGDAYRTPNYQYGHGLNHGFLHAQDAAKLLNNEISNTKYNKHCEKLSSKIAKTTSIIHRMGKLGTKILLYVGNERPDRIRKKFDKIATPLIITTVKSLKDYNKNSISPINQHNANKLIQKCKKAKTNAELKTIIDAAMVKLGNSGNYVDKGDYVKQLSALQTTLKNEIKESPKVQQTVTPQPQVMQPTKSADSMLPPLPALPSNVNVAMSNAPTPTTTTPPSTRNTAKSQGEGEAGIFRALASHRVSGNHSSAETATTIAKKTLIHEKNNKANDPQITENKSEQQSTNKSQPNKSPAVNDPKINDKTLAKKNTI